MPRTIAIGYQNFEQLIQNNCFYIDKTKFIKEWWENKDVVTLITKPRRFGKTLTMSMTEQFFLYSMQGGRICLKAFSSIKRRSIGSCREHIQLSVFLLLM